MLAVAVFDPDPSVSTVVMFAVGWMAGWLLLWRVRPLPCGPSSGAARPAIAVVVPARDEAGHIAVLVAALVAQRRSGDEVLVVDDGSGDGTGDLARGSGADVLRLEGPPPGWSGKPHACHRGAASTSAPLLVFLDADVDPADDLLDRLAASVAAHPSDLTSVQPWHAVQRPYESFSMLFNVVAVMGTGGFTPAGPRVPTSVAFGPVIACTRVAYEAGGGHAADGVRNAILEDIALARCFPRSRLHLGTWSTTTFRMYPSGLGSLVEGWTKGMGIGARATRWWAAILSFAWVWSVAAGWLTSPWFAVATAVQLAVLARRVGRFGPVAMVVFPVHVACFLVVVVRSVVLTALGRQVSWKGRRVSTR